MSKAQTESDKVYLNKSLDKAFTILDLFDSTNNTLTMTEIAEEVDSNPSSLYPILHTLEKYGYLKRDENKLYRLGLTFARKGRLVLDNLSLHQEARTELETLRDSVSRTVHLGSINGKSLVYIDKVESKGIKLYSSPGKTAPLHATGLGKAILAHLHHDQRQEILADLHLASHTKNTITSKEKLREELRKIKKQGFAVDDEEFEEGVKCIAAPINNHSGSVEAAISITGLAAQMGEEIVQEESQIVKKHAEKISKELGYKDNGV